MCFIIIALCSSKRKHTEMLNCNFGIGLSEFREGGNPQGLEKLRMTEWRRSQADPVLGGWRENELGAG